MKEIVFFGMIVIPVYMFSALLDAFVFNAIQFWSGSNAVKMTQGPDGFPEEVHAGAATIHFDWSPARRSATVTYRRNGDVIKLGEAHIKSSMNRRWCCPLSSREPTGRHVFSMRNAG